MNVDIVFTMTDKCGPKKSAEIKQLAVFLGMIAEENRLKIIYLLQNGEKCVCELWKGLDLPQNLVSHHLKMLKKQGLIESRKEGLNVIYYLNEKKLGKHLKKINNLIGK